MIRHLEGNMNRTKKLTLEAVLVSQALVLHYIEGFFPVLAPGAKLGLANIITMVALSILGFKEAMVIVLIRSVLGPLLGGSVTGILYSLSGGILSCLIMAILYYRFGDYFTLMGISTAGAVLHNIGQLLVASWIFGTIGILLTYLPILMLAAVITGYFNGLVSNHIIGYLDRKFFSS